MLKVFHLSLKPAFPSKDGGSIAISSILKSLCFSDEIKVFHFALETHKHPFDKSNYPKEWLKKMEIDSAFIDTKVKPISAIQHLVKDKSYNISRFYCPSVEEKINKILNSQKFDIAIFESIFVLPYLDIFKDKGIKVIVRAHNLEFKIWKSMSENEDTYFKRKYLRILANQIQQYEFKMYPKVDGIIAITDEDSKSFRRFIPEEAILTIPPTIHIPEEPADYSLSSFYFLGSMDWGPNVEGVEWLIKDVFPNGIVNAKFYLAGKSLKEKSFSHPSVVNIGEVEDAKEFIQQHGICLIPIHSGGGVKIKLLENMAMGKPIISTTEGVRGVGVTHNKELLISDNPDEFRELMNQLNFDEKLRIKLGNNARKFVQENFNEEKLTQELIEYLQKI